MKPAVVSEVEQFVSFMSDSVGQLLGLNYYALVWAFVGALIALTQTAKMERIRAVLYVLASTLVGSLMGTALADYMTLIKKPVISFISLCCGLWWQTFLAMVLHIATTRGKAFLAALFGHKGGTP